MQIEAAPRLSSPPYPPANAVVRAISDTLGVHLTVRRRACGACTCIKPRRPSPFEGDF